MSFDITLRDNGAGTFDIALSAGGAPAIAWGKIKLSGTFVNIVGRQFKVGGTFVPAIGYKVKVGGTFVNLV